MRKTFKRLKNSESRKPNSPQIMKKSWSERHAPFASIIAAYSTLVAVLIAGLGYYFTVIPLYQKAAVDELIAKREFELKEVQAEIVAAKREVYEQRRENFIAALERSADVCADIFFRPRSSSLDKEVMLAEQESRIRLDVGVEPCLASVLAQHNASDVLTEIDYQYIETFFSETGIALDQQRVKAKDRISALPSLAVTDPSVLAPVGEYVKKWDEVTAQRQKRLSEINTQFGVDVPALKNRSQERLEYQIGITQVKIADEYRLNAVKFIRERMREMEWPKDVGPDNAKK